MLRLLSKKCLINNNKQFLTRKLQITIASILKCVCVCVCVSGNFKELYTFYLNYCFCEVDIIIPTFTDEAIKALRG